MSHQEFNESLLIERRPSQMPRGIKINSSQRENTSRERAQTNEVINVRTIKWYYLEERAF